MHKIEHDGQYVIALRELESLLPLKDAGSGERIKALAAAIEEYEDRSFPKCQRLRRANIIVAMGNDNVIGKDGTLPWSCPDDLLWFKAYTMDKVIIMGRNTWDSLPVKPLPGRRSIVVTNRPIPGVTCADSVESAIRMAGDDEAVVIGGAQIYEQALPYTNTIYVSRIPVKVEEPNTKFPELDNQWAEELLASYDTFNLYVMTRKNQS